MCGQLSKAALGPSSFGCSVTKESASELTARFPNIEYWVFGGGWIELGEDCSFGSFARAFDEGGMVWEGDRSYDTLEEAMRALDAGIAAWLDEIE